MVAEEEAKNIGFTNELLLQLWDFNDIRKICDRSEGHRVHNDNNTKGIRVYIKLKKIG